MNRKQFLSRSILLAAGSGLAKLAAGSTITQPTAGAELLVNAGIAGNNTNNLLKRIDTDCLAHKPTLTILMVGTNDMNNGKHVPLEKFRNNLNELSDKITGSGSQLLLMTILPFYVPYLLQRHPAAFFQPEGPEGRRKQVNEVIKKIAADKNAGLLDIGSIFEKVGKTGLEKDCLLRNKENSGKEDGVHPTRDGYRFLALAVSQHIQYNQLNARRIVCFGDSITKGDGSIDKESYPAYLKKLLS
ncbi:SGNH/GDSL hydrolase family protein [Pseudoflavitalea rhizosphaerae]|uniref:SGNH/GDSL hydrolase family protein n=1 Tax=Pseudoflavitalea rhizosphaerae TaxID=1884793 RepID=UPI000F8EBECD|nr:GDSL-type esterase/lipase family protein [Pseudoflavitalea rhizosphaerae]